MVQKKQMFASPAEEKLILNKEDELVRFLLANKAIRGVAVQGARLVNQMRANHELGLLETLVLGQACIAAALLSVNLKGGDRIGFNIECSGPIKGLVAEATADGRVRGYLKQVPIPLSAPLDSFDLSPLFGAGFLEVSRYLIDAKRPFTGTIMLQYGNIAQDIANYYLTSEQIPTAMAVSVQFDQQGRVVGAGGLFLQAMPNADEHLMVELEKCMGTMPALGKYFAADSTAVELLTGHFGAFTPQILANDKIEFACPCTEGQIKEMLLGLPAAEFADMRDNGPFPLEVRCHFCNSCYRFEQQELQNLRPEK